MRVKRSINEGRSRTERRRPFGGMGGPSQGPSKRGGSSSGSFSGSRSTSFGRGVSIATQAATRSQGSTQSSASNSARFATSGAQRIDRSGRAQYPLCGSCGRHHSGPCQSGRSGCFHCGQTDHIRRDCPQLLSGDIAASDSIASQSGGGIPSSGQRVTEVAGATSSGA